MRFKWLLACGALLAQTALAAEPVSQAWLKTMAFAKRQMDYSGVFAYRYDDHVEQTRITHLLASDGEYEKLEVLDGSQREVIRHHGVTWWYRNHQLQQQTTQPHGHFPVLLPDQLSALNKNYQIKEIGHDKVAGFDAQVLLFVPNDRLRYVQKMWVHSDTGLLLKMAVLNERNQLVEQYAFTQLQIGGNIDRGWIATQSAVAQANPPAIPNEAPVKSGWGVDAVPAGFSKTKEVLRQMTHKHAPVTQLVYSDGLTAISVFIEPSDGDEDDVENLTCRGAACLYHKVIGRNLYTVVGEVPPKTIIKVLDSIRYNGNK